MKGRILEDWSKVNWQNPADFAKVIGAVNHFFRQPSQPEVRAALKRGVQHFATKGDFPAEVLAVLEKVHMVTDFDIAYEQIFDIRDFTSTNASGFELLDVTSGLTFAEEPVGQKAKVFGMSGEKVSVSFQLFGGALGWHKTLFDDAQYWSLEDNTIAFRNAAYSQRAQSFYNLIEAVPSSQNVTWQTAINSNIPNTDPSYLPMRDAATINAAALAILKGNRSKGTGVTPTTEIMLLVPLDLRPRIEMAMTWLQQAYGGSPGLIKYRITPVYTLMLSSTTTYYAILPKRKLKGGYRMDLTMMSQTDILSYGETVAGWMRYGGAIGDIGQIRRLAIS